MPIELHPPGDEAVRGHGVEHPWEGEHGAEEGGGEAEERPDGHHLKRCRNDCAEISQPLVLSGNHYSPSPQSSTRRRGRRAAAASRGPGSHGHMTSVLDPLNRWGF